MRPTLSFRQYRAMDLTMLTLILVLCEGLIVVASTRWFPDQLYTLSLTAGVTAVVMIRWGYFGAVPAAAGAIVFCLLSRAAPWQYLVYAGGNQLALLLVPLVKKLGGWRKVRETAGRAVLYGLLSAVLMQLGRAGLALLFGKPPQACLLFITTDTLSGVISMLICWVARHLDGMLEDQKHYLDRVGRETEDGGRDA